MQEPRRESPEEGEVMTEMRRVTAIRNGTVVDHIPSGYAMQVIRILGIDADRATPVSLVMNVPSDKIGRKDVLKIEDRELDQEDLDMLALIAPAARIAIIRNHAVAEDESGTGRRPGEHRQMLLLELHHQERPRAPPSENASSLSGPIGSQVLLLRTWTGNR